MSSHVPDPRHEFFIPLDQERLKLTLGGTGPLSLLRPLADSFDAHLWAVVKTVSVPFFMAAASTHSKVFLRYFLAERIRALKHVEPGSPLTPELDQEARQIASKRMNDENVDMSGPLLDELRQIMGDDNLSGSNHELLRQGLVLGWGALEVLTRDLVEALVNQTPALASQLMLNPDTKKLFGKGLTFEAFSEYGFDASKHMGTILVEQHPVNTVESMKHVFGVLFPGDGPLRATLNDRRLMIINQSRHVIVHRRGLIDKEYVRLSQDGTVGERLAVSPERLEQDLLILRDTANAMLAAASPAPP